MLPERISGKVVEDPSGCWIWTGTLQRNGYGVANWVRLAPGRWQAWRVHRIYYEEFIGPIPPGLEVDHVCKVRACVNPAHLRAVTHQENLKTRNHRGPKRTDACKAGHPWTPESTYIQPNGYRACRICRTDAVYRHLGRPLRQR